MEFAELFSRTTCRNHQFYFSPISSPSVINIFAETGNINTSVVSFLGANETYRFFQMLCKHDITVLRNQPAAIDLALYRIPNIIICARTEHPVLHNVCCLLQLIHEPYHIAVRQSIDFRSMVTHESNCDYSKLCTEISD